MRQPLVMVIEDHMPIAMLLCLQAERCGARTCIAPDGRKALRMLETERPDLVLLDPVMPLVSGREVLQAMRSDPGLCEVPVVIIKTQEGHEAASPDALPQLQRPFATAEVERIICQALRAEAEQAPARKTLVCP